MASLADLLLPDGGRVRLRRAERGDLPAVLGLMADDAISRNRETSDLGPYEAAFASIDADPAQLLVVGLDGEEVVCTLQLTVIPGLARRGAFRAQLEAVRVRSDHRGRGLGGELMRWALAEARERGCSLVQLTTDKRRTDAHRFYERWGFAATHEGFKLQL